MKRIAVLLAAALGVTVLCSACSNGKRPSAPSSATVYKVGMVCNMAVNDQSFNQSAWSGLQALHRLAPSFQVGYLIGGTTSVVDDQGCFDRFAQSGYDLVWGMSFLMKDSIVSAAQAYPYVHFALVDESVPNAPANLTCLTFRSQEAAFLVGYIAALKTGSGEVGFVGGVRGAAIDQFEYGFRAGVAYGAKQKGKRVEMDVQYADSFTDSDLGRRIAKGMYDEGCDIIFAAAGNVGKGVIDQAKQSGKLAEGVDLDQSYLAPDNVLTSALKNVGDAMSNLSQNIRSGENDSGKTIEYGLKEDAVGIPYTDQAVQMCGEDVLEETKAVQNAIIQGTVVPPATASDFNHFMSSM